MLAPTYLRPQQATIKNTISASGIGLHSGLPVKIQLCPAPADSGIQFIRVDQTPPVVLVAKADQVSDTRMASVLQQGSCKVSTVEHLLSACSGLGIDNLQVQIDNEEVPIMDGSAATFVYLIKQAGIEILPQKKKFLRVLQTVEVAHGEGHTRKSARLLPYEGFKLDFFIEFSHPKINQSGQTVSIDLTHQDYDEEVGRARTFGFMHEVELLRGMGLARGGSFENAIVMDEYDILNRDEMRYENEFVRHKVLDAIGDLYLAGYPLLAHYQGHRAGHEFNNKLLHALFADPKNFELITLD